MTTVLLYHEAGELIRSVDLRPADLPWWFYANPGCVLWGRRLPGPREIDPGTVRELYNVLTELRHTPAPGDPQ